MLNLGHIRKQIISDLKVLKYGAGEGWRRSVGPIYVKQKYYGVKEKRNILNEIKREKTDWIGHFLHRNCHLKQFIKGKKEGKRRRGRRLRQLLDNFKRTER